MFLLTTTFQLHVVLIMNLCACSTFYCSQLCYLRFLKTWTPGAFFKESYRNQCIALIKKSSVIDAFQGIFRGSCLQVALKMYLFKNFAKVTGIPGYVFNQVVNLQVFFCEVSKIFKNTFFNEISPHSRQLIEVKEAMIEQDSFLRNLLSVTREKGKSQNGGNEKTKHAKFSDKRTFVTVRTVRFS